VLVTDVDAADDRRLAQLQDDRGLFLTGRLALPFLVRVRQRKILSGTDLSGKQTVNS
jgi:hypothetical protein